MKNNYVNLIKGAPVLDASTHLAKRPSDLKQNAESLGRFERFDGDFAELDCWDSLHRIRVTASEASPLF